MYEITFEDYRFRTIHRTAQKMKFSIKDFFSKCDQIRRKLRIWSHLLKKPLIENFIFCAMLLWSYLLKKSLMENLIFCASTCENQRLI